MPYYREVRGTFLTCAADDRGAFHLPYEVAAEWERRVLLAIGGRPTDNSGHRLRPYPELDVASHRPYAPAGIYVDHRDPWVETAAYALRDRLGANPGQATLEPLATVFGLRHWRDAYNTVRNVGRRVTGESGRDTNGDLRWRRWSARGWSAQGAAAAVAADPTGAFRHFGIEIESFGSDGGRMDIARQARAAGMAFHERWHTHNSDPAIRGWQGMRDGSVPGGTEVVSDVLVGDAAAHDEVRDMLRIVRANGGYARQGQGMHVNHDTRDFTRADKVRLVDNLRVLAPLLAQFVPPSRLTEYYARPLSPTEWDTVRAAAAAGTTCYVERYRHFNFQHMHRTDGACRIEWRLLGHTLNGRKVRTWIRVGQAIMAATKAGESFPAGTTTASMLATLRRHGLSQWAAAQWSDRVARRGAQAA